MESQSPTPVSKRAEEQRQVIEMAAELFCVLSAPMRLRIINSLCKAEKNVTELLSEIDTTQPNMSQHLNTLYQSNILGKRRDGVQIYYRIIDQRVANICRVVCAQIASDENFADPAVMQPSTPE